MEMHVVTLVVYRPDGNQPPFSFCSAAQGEDAEMEACVSACMEFADYVTSDHHCWDNPEEAADSAREISSFDDVQSFVMHHMPGWAVREVRNVLAL